MRTKTTAKMRKTRIEHVLGTLYDSLMTTLGGQTMSGTIRTSLIFNGKYTIQNRESGVHRTFRIKTQPKDARFAPGARIVSVMNGTDNQSHYKRFGFVNDKGIFIFKSLRDNKDYDGYARMLWSLLATPESVLHQRYSIDQSLHCLRCNRELTTPESLRTGIGPVCEGRI